MNDISASFEDYLEAIFVLRQDFGAARMTDVADFLGVSKPSVNRAVGTLKEAGYLSHESYGDITLTLEGETYAAKVLHRHKLIKRFLTDTLGVEEEIAQKDACQMEHVMSPRTIELLFKYLEKNSKIEAKNEKL
ncbi:MAG: metal-dependent transcriptional regulator [Clostridiales bacterium]|nr:metal-dependent transcriptional regulator [Clostridiales bacterium]